MPKITLYLDNATQALLERAAQARGLSTSRWITEIIRKYAAHEWPQDCLALAGSFADFPLREETLATQPLDTPRVSF